MNQQENINQDDLINLGEGEFTLNDEQIMDMNNYLGKCHQEKKLNNDQYQFYMNQLWDQDSSFENNIRDLNLWDNFLVYQNTQREHNQQQQQMIQKQKDNLHKKIQDQQDLIQQHQTQISLLKQKLEPLKQPFENAQNRYNQYPDNPRLQAEFQKHQQAMDEIQSQLSNHQNQIEQLETEINLWKTQLKEMTS